MKAVLQEHIFPAWLTGLSRFPQGAGTAAAVHHTHGVRNDGVGKARVLHVHLTGLKIAVGVVVEHGTAGPQLHLNRVGALNGDLLTADKIAALACYFYIIHCRRVLSEYAH